MRRTLLTGAASTLLLSGCSLLEPGPAKPIQVSGSIQAVAGVNPSVNQRPSPLRIVIYELTSAATFNKADFMALYQSDQATLGAELLAREELTLLPGETKPYARTLSPQTRFLGLVAIYRDLERATWRTTLAVQPAKTLKLSVIADKLSVSASLQP